jgi:hypothetical protein
MAQWGRSYSWNWSSAFLGVAWLGFRKMHRVAAIAVAGITALFLLAVLSPGLGLPITISIFVLFGLFGNAVYRTHAAKFVDSAARQHDASGTAALLQARGGTNVWFGILWAVIAWLVMSAIVGTAIAIRYQPSREAQEAADAPSAPSGPKCEVLHVEQSSDAFLVNGEWDFGYEVSTIVRNESASGTVNIVVRLSTSEGTYEREQEVILNKGESMKLEYKFHEPTIGAQNVQAQVGCRP